MADRKKMILKELDLWKKRYSDSKRVLGGVYKDVSKDAKKLIKEATK